MISGFNTDIEFGGTVYHVQTEDKGLQKRVIMSLVYDGGTILASKRVSYDDLAAGNFDEKELATRVSHQHKLICAAVRAGRMDELKEMTRSAASSRRASMAEAAAVIAENAVPAATMAGVPTATMRTQVPLPVGRQAPPLPAEPTPDPFADAPLFDGVQVIEDEILPADAVEVVSELSGQERSSNAKLGVELLGESRFKGGERRTVTIMICRGTDRKVVADAQIMIKVLGSSFRPVIFHARSDVNGLAKIHLQLPHFQAGRAALLVRVISSGEEIELRRVVTPG